MSRTLNTDPYEVQSREGRDHWEVCSQRDLRVVSEVRLQQNRRFRSQVKQMMREGEFDNLPSKSYNWFVW